jgi:hypothetical protein
MRCKKVLFLRALRVEIAHYYLIDELTHEEIAGLLDVSRRTIGNRLDAEALHLAGTRLSSDELRDLVLVIDACRSKSAAEGATRRKGGHPAAFVIDVQQRLQSRGVAILHSSAEGEDSQESDRLAASFFTHYLVSALRGAADSNDDGRVTLVEAFTCASARTLAATARTVAGPQHPTYRSSSAARPTSSLLRRAPAPAKRRPRGCGKRKPGSASPSEPTPTSAIASTIHRI